MVNHSQELTYDTNDMQETAVQTLLLQTEDNEEGIRAFLKKGNLASKVSSYHASQRGGENASDI